MEITRGDIFIADLNPVQGSEQGGIRPGLVIQNDRGNRFSPTVICAAMTSRVGKSDLPTHAWVSARDSGLKCDSLVLCEQIRTLEKRRLRAERGPGRQRARGRHEGEGRERAEHLPVAPDHDASLRALARYPSPRMVTMSVGLDGASSSLSRRRLM